MKKVAIVATGLTKFNKTENTTRFTNVIFNKANI